MLLKREYVELPRSPITGGRDVTLVQETDCATLTSQYKKTFGVDISYLLKAHKTLGLYKCNDSGYRFYYPSDIVGDSAFYHRLEANDWYYMPTKWEFNEALKFIQDDSSVLEIGAGRGDFLSNVQARFPRASCTGLELNEKAARAAQARGINVVVESAGEHAKHYPLGYDVVAAFQVLEHCPNPMEVLRDGLGMLRPRGLLVVGVPDNSARPSASIFVRSNDILNMPPHHQGLWDIPSLSFLQKVLPVRLEHIALEPAIASHHSNSYRGLMKQDLVYRFGRLLGLVIYAIGRPFYDHALHHLNQYLPAHSVLAVFRKLDGQYGSVDG
jgi:SAM-dependent methyltransferase